MFLNVIKSSDLNLNSYLQLLFNDTTDRYDLPAIITDPLPLEFEIFISANTAGQLFVDYYDPLGILFSIFSFQITSLRRFVFFVSDDTGTENVSIFTANNFVVAGQSYIVQITKSGDTYSLAINGSMIGSGNITLPITWTAFEGKMGGNLAAGTKLKNMKNYFQWPTDPIGYLRAWQDVGKTIPASNGQPVAVIETPNGDIVQGTLANQATAIIPPA